MSPVMVLYVLALVFMILAALPVPSGGINWMCASFACLIGSLLIGHAP